MNQGISSGGTNNGGTSTEQWRHAEYEAARERDRRQRSVPPWSLLFTVPLFLAFVILVFAGLWLIRTTGEAEGWLTFLVAVLMSCLMGTAVWHGIRRWRGVEALPPAYFGPATWQRRPGQYDVVTARDGRRWWVRSGWPLGSFAAPVLSGPFEATHDGQFYVDAANVNGQFWGPDGNVALATLITDATEGEKPMHEAALSGWLPSWFHKAVAARPADLVIDTTPQPGGSRKGHMAVTLPDGRVWDMRGASTESEDIPVTMRGLSGRLFLWFSPDEKRAAGVFASVLGDQHSVLVTPQK
ncbi:hypothetical protein [Kribbia dieselivorans]|uniref:hypothetical protein n=1 Tax=Kribbia dieselivorans TaxID=331526 RepID=UPI000839192B|nr:hypothetical protein [Kribbia dieselivorans]